MIKETLLYISTTFQFGSLNSWMYAIICGIGAIFLPISSVIHVMLVLVLVDQITGIMADARRKNIPIKLFSMRFWRNIKSSKLGKSLSKTLAYIMLVMCAFLMDEYMIMLEGHYFTKVIGGAIAFRELISILENVEQVSGKHFITSIIGFIRNGFKKTFADTLEEEHKKRER